MENKPDCSLNRQFPMVPLDITISPDRQLPSDDTSKYIKPCTTPARAGGAKFIRTVLKAKVPKPRTTPAGTSGGQFKPTVSKAKVPNDNVVRAELYVKDFARLTDSEIIIQDNVEETLLSLTDYFLDNILTGAAGITKHKGKRFIDGRDIHQSLVYHYPHLFLPHNMQDTLQTRNKKEESETLLNRVALVRKAQNKD